MEINMGDGNGNPSEKKHCQSREKKCCFVNNGHVNHKDRKDKLIWGASKHGKYSFKRIYEKIINSKQWEKIGIPLIYMLGYSLPP